MADKIKVGVLKETKIPPDRRVVLTPDQVIEVMQKFPGVEVHIQPSNIRCYNDSEYLLRGELLRDDLDKCDILIGVKEVQIDDLIENKIYIFFSHTIKQQLHNREMFREIIKKKITLIDHELFTDKRGFRLVAFGRWAGIVGTYNGLIAFGIRNKLYDLKRAKDCHDKKELFGHLMEISLPVIKILITGGGRVAGGAMEVLNHIKIRKVSPSEFLENNYSEPVYCQLDPDYYVKHKDGKEFSLQHFFEHPAEYRSIFLPYTKVTDLFIPCHFWDPRSPVLYSKEEAQSPDFKISVVADISCDVPGPVASTIRSSTIAHPFYGYNPDTSDESDPFNLNNITVMAIDNLPGELPRDASEDFGKALINRIFPALFGNDTDGIIERATIVKNGTLTEKYTYLSNYAGLD
jgi:alanine dehydrogenase